MIKLVLANDCHETIKLIPESRLSSIDIKLNQEGLDKDHARIYISFQDPKEDYFFEVKKAAYSSEIDDLLHHVYGDAKGYELYEIKNVFIPKIFKILPKKS